MPVSQPRVIELFAGAGVLGYAFKLSGYKLTAAYELDRTAAATYAQNLGSHIVVGDVSRIHPTGKCEVLLAGPPCQGFSTLGARRPCDPRNALSLEVIRWAKALRPRAIVIENVAAFLDSEPCRIIHRKLAAMGYRVNAHVLDAFDYGVPQRRRRSFVIATIGRDITAIKPPRKRITSVCQAWEGLSPRPDNSNHHYAPCPSPIALARMKLIPPGGDKRDVMQRNRRLTPPSWWKLNCEVTDAWGRMEWDKPSNTLRTALQNASKGRYIHPDQHRVISLREAARLHTIPDLWQFEGLPTQIARQIGNSVPLSLSRCIAKAVHNAI